MPTLEIISLVFNFLLGSGLAATLIFYRSKRRTANADAEKSEIAASVEEFAALKMQIEHLSGQLENSYDVVEKQQQIIDNTRSALRDICRRANDLELRLMQEEHARRRAELSRCDADCPLRSTNQ